MDLTPKVLLGLLIILIIIIASLGLIFWPKPFPKSGSSSQSVVDQKQFEEVFKEATITTFIVNPKSTTSFVKLERTRIHLPPSIDIKPKEASGSFIFKADIVSKTGQVLYSSWKNFPIINPNQDGSFEAKVLTPYQKDAILRLKNIQDEVILIRIL